MTAEKLFLLSTTVLAISLANERLIALIKTIIPWLAIEALQPNGLVDPDQDRLRNVILFLLTVASAFITTGLISHWHYLDPYKTDGMTEGWPYWVIAILSTGGSSFWTSILGYATAAKDIKEKDRAIKRMQLADLVKLKEVSIRESSTL